TGSLPGPGFASLPSMLSGGVADGVVALAATLHGARARLHTVASRPAAGIRPAFRRARFAAGHDVVDLLRVDGLVLDQRLCHQVQLVGVGAQDIRGPLVVAVDDRAHLVVDVALRGAGNLRMLGDGVAE